MLRGFARDVRRFCRHLRNGGEVPLPSIVSAVRPRGRRLQWPAIQMERADHKLTASYGRTGAAKAHQQRQKKLISEGRFDDAIQMDIDDVASKFPGKYDEAILQMIDTLP